MGVPRGWGFVWVVVGNDDDDNDAEDKDNTQ